MSETHVINDGGPAFARPYSEETSTNEDYERRWFGSQEGMSLRDYFAAKALGRLAGFTTGPASNPDDLSRFTKIVAEHAYAYADAMLAARKVKP